MVLPTLPQGVSVACSVFLGGAVPYLLSHASPDWRAMLSGAALAGFVALAHLYQTAPKAEEIVK